MTLTALRIANFKAFAASQRVPLRPITLVYGANGAGKSSILHALTLAHYAVETGELDVQRTQIGGESIDLGGFRQYVHRRERERQVELAFEVDPRQLSGRVAEMLGSAASVVVELTLGLTRDSLSDRPRVSRDSAPANANIARSIQFLRRSKLRNVSTLFDALSALGLVIVPGGRTVSVKIATGPEAGALGRPSLLVISENGDVEIVEKWLRRDLEAALEDKALVDGLVSRLLDRTDTFRTRHARFPQGYFLEVRGREREIARIIADFAREVREATASETRVGVTRFSVEVDGKPLLAMSARAGGVLRLDRLEHGHPVFRELFRGLLMLATTAQEVRDEDLAALGQVLDALVPSIAAKAPALFPRIEEDTASGKTETWEAADLVAVSRGRRADDLARAARLFLPRALRELVGGLGSALESELRRLRYLGPLRSYPPRHLAFSQHHDPNWFAGGGYAWDVVRTREDVRRRVNAWLGDPGRLKTPYELEVRDLLPATAVAADLPQSVTKFVHDYTANLMDELLLGGATELQMIAQDVSERLRAIDHEDPEDLIPEVENVVNARSPEMEAIVQGWVDRMVRSQAETLHDLVLVDKRSGTPVSHRDVGIGVSQVLPVLVAAYASKDKLLAIEQPEIHLHPALQAELGDVFLEAALGGGANTLLIESHSEHLLLRIMRRMRETFEGRLPEGIPEVRPEHVMVLFVEPDGPRSIVREMPLNERGELVKAWPGGFFEEGLREIF